MGSRNNDYLQVNNSIGHRCRCCGQFLDEDVFRASILGHLVSYYECRSCCYVQTEDPFWLPEAYASPINASDTGIMARNLSNVSLVLATLVLMGCRKSRVVDYAGGHGFLVRLLRDIGIDALWMDAYCENLVARGFEYNGMERVALVSAFEVFEHFVSPRDEMEKLLGIAPNILLTTSLIPEPSPRPHDWWYYGLNHGQHIGFFRVQTLRHLASKFNLHLLTDGSSRHLFTEKRYSYITWRLIEQTAKRIPRLVAMGLYSKIWPDYMSFFK
jgi:hypothetical protein